MVKALGGKISNNGNLRLNATLERCPYKRKSKLTCKINLHF